MKHPQALENIEKHAKPKKKENFKQRNRKRKSVHEKHERPPTRTNTRV